MSSEVNTRGSDGGSLAPAVACHRLHDTQPLEKDGCQLPTVAHGSQTKSHESATDASTRVSGAYLTAIDRLTCRDYADLVSGG